MEDTSTIFGLDQLPRPLQVALLLLQQNYISIALSELVNERRISPFTPAFDLRIKGSQPWSPYRTHACR